MRAHRGDDTGSGTLLVLIAALALWAGAALAMTIGAAIVARHRAGTAADLAALAAARAALRGADACAAGSHIAAGNGAALVGCLLTAGGQVDVRVKVPLTGLVASVPGLPPAEARSRAGPA